MKLSLPTEPCSLFSLVFLLTSFLSIQSIIVRAQSAGFEAGLAGQTANMNSNVIGMNAIAISGSAKIKSGRATTTFAHSPDIYRYMLSQVTFDETEPKTEAGRMQLIQEWVSRFEARMIKAGNYKVHDYADAASFACLLSYQALYDKWELTPLQLEIFRRDRHNTHLFLLSYASYQGSTDQFKEKLYIWDAMASIQAIEWREKTRAARTEAERQDADEKAKHFAEWKMKLYTEENLRELEHNATVTFTRNNTLLSAAELAEKYNIGERKVKSLLLDFDAEVTRRGGATNDAAWVNAVSFALVYEVYTDGKVKLNQQQFDWVLKEMQKDMLSQVEYQALSNDAQQKYYEQVAIKGMIVIDNYRLTGSGNAEIKHKAQVNLQETFSPRKLEDYQLRPNGFVKVR